MPIPATGQPSVRAVRAFAALLLCGLVLSAFFTAGVAAGRGVTDSSTATENHADDSPNQGPDQTAIAGIGARHLYLPLGTVEGEQDVCSATVAVQNVGDEPSKALLLTWSEHADPGGADVPPDGLLCSGLLRPGATWEWQISGPAAGDSGGMASGALFSFTAKTLSEIGAGLGYVNDDVVADAACDTLASSVVDDAVGYVHFRHAYAVGLSFGSIPMHSAIGAPLAAQVLRECPGDTTRGVQAAALYDVQAAHRLGEPDPHFGVYEYHGSPFYRSRAGMTSTLHIQNAGAEDITVDVWTRPANACGGDAHCMTIPLTPGVAASVSAADCIREDSHYATWLSSTGPIAAAMSVSGNDSLVAHAVAPAGALKDPDGEDVPPETRYSLSGPLVYDNSHGWSTAVEVENLSSTLWADVEVVFVDRGGSEILAQLAYICPRGARTFTLAASSLRPGVRVGGVRVASLPPQADPSGERSQIAAVALTARKAELGGDEILEYGSYRLIDGPAPQSGTTTSSGDGVGVVAVPHVAKDLDRTGATSEIAVTDLASDLGWTDIAVLLFDQNALVETLCRRVNAGGTEYIDLQTLGVVDQGFRGSALVSATYWEHLPVGAPPKPARDAVAIGAASVWRMQTVIGQDLAGDELAIAVGTPLERLPADTATMLGDPCDRHAPPPPPAPVVSLPPAALAGQVALPALNRETPTGACQATALRITNTGAEPGKAAVMTWGDADLPRTPSQAAACAPWCSGPLSESCTGLLAPGGTWTIAAAELPPDAASAAVFSLSMSTMAEIGAEPPIDQPVADVLCEDLVDRPTAKCTLDRRFRLTYTRGLVLAAWVGEGQLGRIPMLGAIGPSLAVEVDRSCDRVDIEGAKVDTTYAGIQGTVTLDANPSDGSHSYAVAGVAASYAGSNSLLSIQNAGVECTTVEARFRASGDCLHDRVYVHDLEVAPGATVVLDPRDIVGPRWFGSVVVRGQEPLAVVREIHGNGRVLSATAFAASSAYDLDGDWRVDASDADALTAALGSRPGDASWNVRADVDGNEVVNDTDRLLLEMNLCGAANPDLPEPPPAEARPAVQAALPILNASGPDDVPCHATIEVQNVGQEDTGVVLVAWDEAGDPLEPCAGPTRVECSGLIRPGGIWLIAAEGPIDGRGLLSGARSAMVFSFSAEVVEIWPTPEASSSPDRKTHDLWYSLMCETLLYGAVGDCDDYAKFKAAFDSGGTFAGIPMDRAVGAPVAARVRRECLGEAPHYFKSPTASYAAVGANQFGVDDPARGGYVYYAPSVVYETAGFTSAIHLQNAGSQPATVELWVQAEHPCGDGQLCNVWTIDPGETVSTESCGRGDSGGGWQGAARVKSNRPLGVVVETVGRESVYDYAALPGWVEHDAAGRPMLAGSGQVLFGQLAFDPGQSWDTAVRIQNLSTNQAARVRAEFRDAYGAIVESVDASVCAGGSQTFVSLADGSGSALPPGSVRVESLPLLSDRGAPPAELMGVVESFEYLDPTRATLYGAFSTHLQPEPEALVWPDGAGAGGLESGIGVVAVPALRVADRHFSTDALAITNRVQSPGWTEMAVILRDQNAVVDVLCRRIYAGQVDYIELGALPNLAAGFHGSAVISARVWQHPVLDRRTGTGRNLVSLGAAAVRKSHRFGPLVEAIPAIIGAVEGTPLRELPWSANEPLGDLCRTMPPLSHHIHLPTALKGQ